MVKRPARPNLLMIWTDEQRADTLACYGNDHVQAPNLNRLASRSFVFENAYCCQPVCTPSRGCILSGLWPHQHGARFNNEPIHAGTRTIAEIVDPAYRRAYHGKWHLGDEIIAQHGFDEWVSTEDAMYRPYYSRPEYLERRSSYHHYLIRNGYQPNAAAQDGAICFSRKFTAAMAPQYTKAGFLGNTASQFIREHDQSRPFMLSVNFLEPHMPFFGPYNDRHDPDAVPVGEAFGKRPAANASLRNRVLADLYTQHGHDSYPLSNDAERRRLRANYYGLVTLVDDAVGRILDTLEQTGQADNTIVVFTSDHGEMMGDHCQLAKGVLYEQAVRIPWMIHVPWLSRKQHMIPGRVSQIDLAPTLLDLLGESPRGTGHMMGRSRRDVLEGSATLQGNDVITIWDGTEYSPKNVAGYTPEELASVPAQRWRSIITADGWKLNLCATDKCELYDLNSDPAELANRIDDPAQQSRVKDLTARIRAWQRTVSDDAPLPA